MPKLETIILSKLRIPCYTPLKVHSFSLLIPSYNIHTLTHKYMFIYIYIFLYIYILYIYLYIFTFIHIFINQSRPSHAERCHCSFIQTPRAWEIHSSSKGCWRQSLGSRAPLGYREMAGVTDLPDFHQTWWMATSWPTCIIYRQHFLWCFPGDFQPAAFFGANGTSSGECFLQVFWMVNDGDMILVWCTITCGIIFL